jgi:serine/threonine protein kinase
VFDIGTATDVDRLAGKTDCRLVEKLRIMRDLVAGLASLHELDLAHGDISKENVLVIQTADGPSAVLDWLYNVKSSPGDANLLQDRTRLRDLLWGLPCAEEADESRSDVFIRRLVSLAKFALIAMNSQSPLNDLAQALDGIYKTYMAHKNQLRTEKPEVIQKGRQKDKAETG